MPKPQKRPDIARLLSMAGPITRKVILSLPYTKGQIDYRTILHDAVSCLTQEEAETACMRIAVMPGLTDFLLGQSKKTMPVHGLKAAMTKRPRRYRPSEQQ